MLFKNISSLSSKYYYNNMRLSVLKLRTTTNNPILLSTTTQISSFSNIDNSNNNNNNNNNNAKRKTYTYSNIHNNMINNKNNTTNNSFFKKNYYNNSSRSLSSSSSSSSIDNGLRLFSSLSSSSSDDDDITDNDDIVLPMMKLIDAYKRFGHQNALLNPLDNNNNNNNNNNNSQEIHDIINQYDLNNDQVLDMVLTNETKRMVINDLLMMTTTTGSTMENENMDMTKNHLNDHMHTIRDVMGFLKQTYSSTIGYEFEHVENMEERKWFVNEINKIGLSNNNDMMIDDSSYYKITTSERINSLQMLLQTTLFEEFLGKKFSSFKRYSGEGTEVMQIALSTIFQQAATTTAFNNDEMNEINEIVLSKAHRGRLALLVSQLQYPLARLFYKIKGNTEFMNSYMLDDVTSHIASSIDKQYNNTEDQAKNIHISLIHNPSHLEIAGCVANGKTRAKLAAVEKVNNNDKNTSGGVIDKKNKSILCLQIHGDSAMSGQGCVAENFSLSLLPGMSVNGSMHIVINNQIGFTTSGLDSRSSRYSTDMAKQISAPVIHVNTDDVENVIRCTKLALRYRQKFGKDIVLDLIGYRRYGHNEVDEPKFTNPQMYDSVETKARALDLYAHKLIHQDDIITEKRLDMWTKKFENHLDMELKKSLTYDIHENEPDAFQGKWEGMIFPNGNDIHERVNTGVPKDILIHTGISSVMLPSTKEEEEEENFEIHQRLKRSHIDARLKLIENEKSDWATAEAMAFGSLMAQGHNVRLCGQDSGRGTFSQRHAQLTDQKTGKRYSPFQHIPGSSGTFEVVNSNLSELAVLAFEYGYSIEDPKNLVLWEAQFGDFHNGAQIVIDAFISGSETKWLRQTSLTLLLPHGYDGAGPEHSSARIERFLQLCDAPGVAPPHIDIDEKANTNMRVVNMTTPANYFHVLRRQQITNFRKPLIVIAPKTLLRHPEAISNLDDMGPDSSFQPIIVDKPKEEMDANDITRIIFCSGKIVYDLKKRGSQEENSSLYDKTVIIRLEELAPFPYETLREKIAEFPNVESYYWVQEEPLNAGAYSYISPQISRILRDKKDIKLDYIGRPALATPAVGLSVAHKEQVEDILHKCWSSE